ncbi:hypothetical protein LG3211_3560 [Lysobacter gummosus]|nr:hypothetical protein LG3211_3560 [Lysobacter gummosus]
MLHFHCCNVVPDLDQHSDMLILEIRFRDLLKLAILHHHCQR